MGASIIGIPLANPKADQPSGSQALENVEAELGAVAAGVGAITSTLDAARSEASGLAGEAGRLAGELAASRARGRLVSHFLQQYQLQPDEVAALQVGRY